MRRALRVEPDDARRATPAPKARPGVADVDTIPVSRPKTATAAGQRRRHIRATLASMPPATSRKTCWAGHGSGLSCSSGLRNSAPNVTARTNSSTSTIRSRPACLPVVSNKGTLRSAAAGEAVAARDEGNHREKDDA